MLTLAAAGCGGGGGVAEGATVTVYVSAPLHGDRAIEGKAMCAGAERLTGSAGDVRVQVVCLDDTGGGGHWSLAAVGANARRAAEDSTAVGYIGDANPTVRRFSQPMLESAGIASIYSSSGKAAMAQLLAAIHRAGGGPDLREAVRDNLAGS